MFDNNLNFDTVVVLYIGTKTQNEELHKLVNSLLAVRTNQIRKVRSSAFVKVLF